jgi:succinate dehydrogenase/fumarate reductase-like Fe-S protein
MALACGSRAMAQGQQVTPMGGSTVQHPMSTAPLTVDLREDQSAMYQQMKQQRNALRQRKLLEKTQQLQQLSDELRAEVAKTDKDTLSVDVIRKSEQIEKLAKSIHELIVTPL